MAAILSQRHIQNYSDAGTLEPHWGYVDRVLPCTSDAGSCAYLDVVYHSHDLGMMYAGIFWATIAAILLLTGLYRFFKWARSNTGVRDAQSSQASDTPRGGFRKLAQTVSSASRRYLLPTSWKPVFGYASRLQVVILLVLAGYLLIWTFVGIVYKKWVTPVKASPGVYNTRTSLGPWADRVGIFAYALTPLSILLASRESVLSLITGIPYTSFMFLHRWTGYIILIQSALHTLGWVIVEGRLYQPQPTVWKTFSAELYIQWGWAALGLLLLLWILTFSWVIRRVTGYEFFRKAHYVLAMVYIGAIIGHWSHLECFLIPSIILWGLDRGVRLARTALLHYGYRGKDKGFGFQAAQAEALFWKDDQHGDIVRLDFEHRFTHPQTPWNIGEHFYLCFPESSIWQSHPFTPLSLPVPLANGRVKHSYIFRAKGGETKKVANILKSKLATGAATTSVILQGPYGENIVNSSSTNTNILCVAGGTGVTYVLPVLLKLIREAPNPNRRVDLVWAIKRESDLEWISPELDEIRAKIESHGINLRFFVTEGITEKATASTDEDAKPASQSSIRKADSIRSLHSGRPELTATVQEFVEGVTAGTVTVYGSGPLGMIDDLRASVAKCNSGAKVWRGEERFNVQLVCDDRLEG